MAYEIIKLRGEKREHNILYHLQSEVEEKDRSRGKKYEIWKGGFDVKGCRTEKFILQKLIYIHENPLQSKWKLCQKSLEYLHGSTRFYFKETQELFHVRDYREFVDWENMTKPTSPLCIFLIFENGVRESRRGRNFDKLAFTSIAFLHFKKSRILLT
jgi:hypothetical protein